jgi:hypothetical protein
MAAQHLTFVPLAEFPQVQELALDRTIAELDRLVSRTFAKVHLTRCHFEDQYCDCREVGVVHHIASERDLCLTHFKAVNRG